jgi:hypothetical protein
VGLYQRDGLSGPLEYHYHLDLLPGLHSYESRLGPSSKREMCATQNGTRIYMRWNQHIYRFGRRGVAFAFHLEA